MVANKLAALLTNDGYESKYKQQDSQVYTPLANTMYTNGLKRLKEAQRRVVVAGLIGLTCLFSHVAHHIKFLPPIIAKVLCCNPTHIILSLATMIGPAR